MMSQYEIKDAIIEYERIGTGFPVLFLHGWGMDRRIMSGCFELVFEESSLQYCRIYIDLPGMGKSVPGKEIRNSDDVLDILYHFAKDIVGNRFMIAGESYGGYLARGFVRRYPQMVASLILLCPLVYSEAHRRNVEPLTVIKQDGDFLRTLTKEQYDSFTYMNVVLTKSVWKLYQRDILPAIMEQNRYFLDHVLDGAFSFDVDRLETPFPGPCLILAGKQDTQVGYKDQFALLDIYPNATYCAVNGAGHNLQIEQPELFRALVSQWLSGIES